MEKHIRKLTLKGKYSYLLILPKELVEKYGWKDRQKLTIQEHGKEKLLIQDWKPKKKK